MDELEGVDIRGRSLTEVAFAAARPDIPMLEVKEMAVNWNTDADAALAEAKETRRPVLIDFSAAPA